MKVSLLVLLCVLGAFAAPQQRSESEEVADAETPVELTRAYGCEPDECVSPDCRCSSTVLDRDIPIERTPQLVMLTFDDAVTAANYEYIQEILGNRFNPDGCPAAATFFVSHEYTDYSKVHALWTEGHEIALHSISHAPDTRYWKNASVDLLMREFSDERDLISHFAQIDPEDIKGVRIPLFQLAGNNSFEMIQRAGLVYDCSMPSQHYTNPGMWPYSLDYLSTQDCPVGDCPTASLPNVWVAPILSWTDMEGYQCAMVDACQYLPEDDTEAMFQWMKSNFERQYLGNRAPFGVFIHAAWFLVRESHLPAYIRFVEYMNSLPDVYLVSVAKAVEFTRNPKPVFVEELVNEEEEEEQEIPQEQENEEPVDQEQEQEEEVNNDDWTEEFPEKRKARMTSRSTQIYDSCQVVRQPSCTPRLCSVKKEATNEERWMTVCGPCPAVYPWLDNPLGLNSRRE